MIRIILFTFISLLLTNISFAGNYKRDAFSACSYTKITPINYLSFYKITKKRFLRYAKRNTGTSFTKWNDFLKLETRISKDKSPAKCEWNKFILTDFIFYHEQAQDFFGEHQKLPFLELRDKFYTNWLSQLDIDTKLLEKSQIPTPMNEINHESQEFGFLSSLTSIFNFAPDSAGESGKALTDVYNLLEGKSVFNAIFSSYAKERFLNKNLLETSKCISETIKRSTGQNIWSEIQICNSSKQVIMDVLGVFSSQRMYLIRDFKTVMYKNLNDTQYEQFSELLDVTSTIYFQLETYGNKYGHVNLYPLEYADRVYSQKPYHFYSVGFIAMKLKNLGYSDEIIQKSAVQYARRYKVNIKRIGVIYNLLLVQNLNKGTVGDYDNVIKEQDLGATFGIRLGE
jgi:hypothetical protein